MRARRRGSGAAYESMCRRESGNTTIFGTKDTKALNYR